jgi:hypothetical protein
MAAQTLKIVIDDATGRLGTTQHLKALLASVAWRRAADAEPQRSRSHRAVPQTVAEGR